MDMNYRNLKMELRDEQEKITIKSRPRPKQILTKLVRYMLGQVRNANL